MSSSINKENENISTKVDDTNKENCPNNLDDINKNQIKISKNQPKKNKSQIKKGLNVLDQNNNRIKKPSTINQIKTQTIDENINSNITSKYSLIDINSNYFFQGFDYNNFDNTNLLNINLELSVPKLNEGNLDINLDISPKSREENDEMLILSPPIFLENDIISEWEHQNITKNINQIHAELIPLNVDINKMFSKRESENLLLKYGESSYKYNKVLEESVFKIPSKFLSKHKITPSIRTKMVDWMIEVLSVFDSSEETFFLSVNIMDLFLWKTPNFYKSEDVHLIGVSAMFIASKFQEIYPIPLEQFVHKIGHDKFNANDIKKMEYQILKDIRPECLVTTSIYDFSKTYFYDFYYNNNNLISSEEDYKIYKYIKYTSIYLNKLVLHYECFYQGNCSLKAIGCIVCSLKIVADNLKEEFNQKIKGVYNDWMLFLIKQGGLSKQKVEILANKIYAAYQRYQKSKSISKNLNKFSPLPYIE